MLFPESTPKKKRGNNKENVPPAQDSPQPSPGAGNAVGDDDGFTNQSMSIIPSSLSLAATAMTNLAARSAARASAKAKEKEDSAGNPRPSTSKAAATLDDPPMDPFAGQAGGSKHGKGTKGLKGRAKVRNLGVSVVFPSIIFFCTPADPRAGGSGKGSGKRPPKQKGEETERKDGGTGKGLETPRKNWFFLEVKGFFRTRRLTTMLSLRS